MLNPLEVIALFAEEVACTGAATVGVGGRLRFIVPGAGAWTLSLATPGGAWSVDADPVDVTVTLAAEHLEALVSAPDSLAELAQSGAIGVDGDPGKLAALGRLLGARVSLAALHRAEIDRGGRHARTRR